MKRWLSFDSFWLIILLSLMLFMSHMLITGQVNQYLHPKLQPFLGFSLAVLLVLSLVQVKRLSSGDSRAFQPAQLVFFIPLLFYFHASTNPVEAVYLDNKTVTSQIRPQEDYDRVYRPGFESATESTSDLFSEITFLSPDEFAAREGETVELIGFVYRNKADQGDDFLLARMLMICCVADTQIVGLPTSFPGSTELKLGSWVKVTGRLAKRALPETNEWGMGWTPSIIIDSLEPTDQPIQHYIYQ